jgi:hypothetical protein
MKQRNLPVSIFMLFGFAQYSHVQTNCLKMVAATLPPMPLARTWAVVRPIAWLFGFLLIIIPAIAHAQPWSGILSPSRATDWSSPGVVGGIPNRSTICAALNPGATAAQINSAIAACPNGHVVFLNAGTYNLSSGITFGSKSNVTLRGAGPDQTKLVFTGSINCQGVNSVLCIQGNWVDPNHPPNSTTWTAGYAAGMTVITLASAANVTVGEMLFLDQLDDSSDSGGIYVCSSTSCSEEGGGHGRPGRGQIQVAKVTAVNGNNVTISTGLRMPNWRLDRSPGAFWNANNRISGDGFESLSADVTGVSGANGIVIIHGSNSWVKKVRIINPGRAHVWCYQCMQITVRDSYFYGGQGSGSQSYGFETYGGSAENLVENNILQHVTAPFSIDGPDVGSVYAYNFSIDDNYTASPGFMIKTFMLHEVGISHDLFEGNDGLGFTHDDIHGTAHFATLFRNHFYGDIWNNPPKTDSTATIDVAAWGRFFNIVGNVLGRAGYHNTYEVNLGSSSSTIFGLGWTRCQNGNCKSGINLPTDANVKTTMMRWGNYDTVNNAVRFVNAEVPSSLVQYANPVPAGQNLPASFYLSAKPSWFGATPWPAIGPDITGGQHTAGHAYKIPARLCWEQGMLDTVYGSANIRQFKPDVCYGPV